jgi:hypothetical protein
MFKTVTWVYRTDTIMTASSNGEELVCNWNAHFYLNRVSSV